MKYRLAAGVCAVKAADGPLLLSRRPLRALRVSPSLLAILEDGDAVIPRSKQEREVLEALTERGLAERLQGVPRDPDALPSVSVVIPVKDRAEELRRCLQSLGRVRYPGDKLEILVVDDGSHDETPRVARSLGATVIPSGAQGRGPAAARNRGAAAAREEILAFIDSDCTASESWLTDLAAAFEDPEVAAAGGRVEGMHASGALDRYEAEMSSLCLGRRERSAQGGNDTFYLPSCNLLVRRLDFLAAGGFREELRVGEDVDLTWRLRDRGGKILYSPRGRVWHEHRNRFDAFLTRRFQYGTSEALLRRLHPERRKTMVVPPALGAAVGLAASSLLLTSWLPVAFAAGLLALDSLRFLRVLRRQGLPVGPGAVLCARVRVWASLVYYVSYHLVRYYGGPLLVAGVAWPRFGLLAAGLALWSGTVDYGVRRPALPFPAFLGLYLAEHLAYGAGVFWGCLKRGTFGTYRVVVAAKA